MLSFEGGINHFITHRISLVPEETSIAISRAHRENLTRTAELLGILRQSGVGANEAGSINGLFVALSESTQAEIIDVLSTLLESVPRSEYPTTKSRIYPSSLERLQAIAKGTGCTPASGPLVRQGSVSMLARKMGSVEPGILAEALKPYIGRDDDEV